MSLTSLDVLNFGIFVGKEITSNPDILQRIYSMKLSKQEMKYVTRSLIAISTQIGSFDNMINELLRIEFESHAFNVFRRNTLTTKLLDQYFLELCHRYLSIILREPIHLLLSIDCCSCEIDPKKIAQKMIQEYEQRYSQRGSCNFKRNNWKPNQKKVQKIVKKNVSFVENILEIFCGFIFSDESVNLMPFELRTICSYIRQYALKHFPNDNPLPRVGAMIILRMFNPAILFPEKLKIVDPVDITPERRRGLLLISKCIQLLANYSKSREEHMSVLENVLEKQQIVCDDFLKRTCLDLEEIKKKKRVLLKLKNSLMSSKKYGDVCLVFYHFLKTKGFKDILPIKDRTAPKENPRKYGRIVFLCTIDVDSKLFKCKLENERKLKKYLKKSKTLKKMPKYIRESQKKNYLKIMKFILKKFKNMEDLKKGYLMQKKHSIMDFDLFIDENYIFYFILDEINRKYFICVSQFELPRWYILKLLEEVKIKWNNLSKKKKKKKKKLANYYFYEQQKNSLVKYLI